jgi:hypothetical protein
MHQDALLESAPVLLRHPHRNTGRGETMSASKLPNHGFSKLFRNPTASLREGRMASILAPVFNLS